MYRNKIYEKDPYYSFLRPCVDRCTRLSYNKIEVRGKENIPADGAILLAPNHCNTLMDALVVLQAFGDESVFGARADMFKRQLIAKIMYFVRILPMVRQRDGLRNVLKNYETQDIIVETLEHDVRFCMFPEGRHRPAHSLLPLGKGIFRAALAANAKFGAEKPVYIVPTGLEYGDYFRYRSTCLVNFGKAINVTEFIKGQDTDNEAHLMEALRKELHARMSETKTYIPDGEDYDGKWALTRILALDSAKKDTLEDRMLYNRYVVGQIEKAMEADPEKMAGLLEEAAEFDRKRRKHGISIWSFGKSSFLLKSVIALLGIPYFIFAAIASLPMWATFEFLKCRLKDRAFHNTAGFGIKLGMGWLVFIGWAVAAFCTMQWLAALLFSLLTIPSYGFFYDYVEFMRKYISDIRLMGNRKLADKFKKIKERFQNI